MNDVGYRIAIGGVLVTALGDIVVHGYYFRAGNHIMMLGASIVLAALITSVVRGLLFSSKDGPPTTNGSPDPRP